MKENFTKLFNWAKEKPVHALVFAIIIAAIVFNVIGTAFANHGPQEGQVYKTPNGNEDYMSIFLIRTDVNNDGIADYAVVCFPAGDQSLTTFCIPVSMAKEDWKNCTFGNPDVGLINCGPDQESMLKPGEYKL